LTKFENFEFFGAPNTQKGDQNQNRIIMVNTEVYTEIHLFLEPLFSCIDENGIGGDIGKIEWHILKLCFCNGISATCELESGIKPIHPKEKYHHPNENLSVTFAICNPLNSMREID
jgi:hypothetical protein